MANYKVKLGRYIFDGIFYITGLCVTGEDGKEKSLPFNRCSFVKNNYIDKDIREIVIVEYYNNFIPLKDLYELHIYVKKGITFEQNRVLKIPFKVLSNTQQQSFTASLYRGFFNKIITSDVCECELEVVDKKVDGFDDIVEETASQVQFLLYQNRRNVYYIFDAGESVFYLEGNEIKKFILSEFRVRKVYEDNGSGKYDIFNYVDYMKDVHGRTHEENPNNMGFFKTKSLLIKYIKDPDAYEQNDDYLKFHDVEKNNRKTTVKIGLSDLNDKNDYVWSFLDGRIVNVRVKGIIYTRKKSLVDYRYSTDIKYILQKFEGDWVGDEWVVDGINIYEKSEKYKFIDDIIQKNIIYTGCDFCKELEDKIKDNSKSDILGYDSEGSEIDDGGSESEGSDSDSNFDDSDSEGSEIDDGSSDSEGSEIDNGGTV